MEFSGLGGLAAYLASLPTQHAHALQEGLEQCAASIEKTAKDEFGHYQDAAGPFNAWDPLAESTKADRLSKGFSEDEPLLRTGEMRDSITHEVDGLEAVVGAKDQKMVWHEFGTNRIPPRPVLGPALVRNKSKILKIIGHTAVSGLFGGHHIHESLGYDDEV